MGDHVEIYNGEVTLSFDEEAWKNFMASLKKDVLENPEVLKRLKKGFMGTAKIPITREGKQEDFWIGIILTPNEQSPTSFNFAIKGLSIERCERCGKELTPRDKKFDTNGNPSHEGVLCFCSRDCWRKWYEEYYEFKNVWIP